MFESVTKMQNVCEQQESERKKHNTLFWKVKKAMELFWTDGPGK